MQLQELLAKLRELDAGCPPIDDPPELGALVYVKATVLHQLVSEGKAVIVGRAMIRRIIASLELLALSQGENTSG